MNIKNAFLEFLNENLRTCIIFSFKELVEAAYPVRIDQSSLVTSRTPFNWLSLQFTILRLDKLVKRFGNGGGELPLAAINLDDAYRAQYSLIKTLLNEFGLKISVYVSSTKLPREYYWQSIVKTYRQTSYAKQQAQLRLWFNYLLKSRTKTLIESIKYLSLEERQLVMSPTDESTVSLLYKRGLIDASDSMGLADGDHLICGHNFNCPILDLKSKEKCVNDICDDFTVSETLFNEKVSCFAYPNEIQGRYFREAIQQILATSAIDYTVTIEKLSPKTTFI